MSSPLLGWMAIEVSRKRNIKRVELYPTPALNLLPASGRMGVYSDSVMFRWSNWYPKHPQHGPRQSADV